MGKKKDKIGGDTVHNVAETPASEAKSEAEAAVAKARGPRGVPEDAVITVLTPGNPKRDGSKAHAAFASYASGMTVKQFTDAVGKDATGHLVYDAKHGFISIAGYDPGAIVAPKEKAPKKEKAAKKEAAEPSAEVQAEVAQETME